MNSTFRFAIVGSGNISNTYIKALQHIDRADCVAIVSRSGNKPTALAEQSIEIAPTISAIQTSFDAVILATPNGLHHQSAIEAARSGKHVLTEKVLDVTLEHCDEMISACRDNNVKLAVAYQRRMSPDNIIVKQLLTDGKLGKIFAADLEAKFYRDQAYYDSAAYRGNKTIDGGGPFIQQAAHNLDIYTWFFGVPAKVASSLGTFLHDIESEDHGAAITKHENGMVGTIIASTCCKPGFSAKIAIYTDKGNLVLENDQITHWQFDHLPNPARETTVHTHDGAASATVTETSGHEAIIQDFIQAICENRNPAISGEEGRKSVELIQMIYANTI